MRNRFLHEHEEADGEIREKLRVGGRHSVIGQRGSWRPWLPSDVLQDFVGCFIDKKSSYHEDKCSRTRRKSISYEKNTAKIWEEGKECSNKASGVIGGVERNKREVKMSESTQLFSKLKILCRISITGSRHSAIVYQAARAMVCSSALSNPCMHRLMRATGGKPEPEGARETSILS